MRIHDISRMIDPEAAVYPGDDPLEFSEVCSIGPEAPCNITALGEWTTHFLTHVDPPRHFIADGATLDEIGLDRFIGPAVVIEVTDEVVGAAHVVGDLQGRSVLFKTRNSRQDPAEFDEGHVYVGADAVAALIAAGVNMVGLDYHSVDRFGDEEYPAHRGLLGAGILILEGADLSAVEPGVYQLIALPMKIRQGDGSPVRAVLVEND